MIGRHYGYVEFYMLSFISSQAVVKWKGEVELQAFGISAALFLVFRSALSLSSLSLDLLSAAAVCLSGCAAVLLLPAASCICREQKQQSKQDLLDNNL